MSDDEFKYIITDEFKHFAEKQLSQIKDDPEFYLEMSKSEFNAMKKHIKYPKKILELGCGLGRMSIFINHKFNNDNIHFILADVSKESEKIKYGWNPKESYYNNLDLTKKFVEDHNLKNFELFDLLSGDLNRLSDIDMVMSFLSVGFHYPIDQYMSKLLDITTDNCTMFFGVRQDHYDLDYFKQYFKSIHIQKNTVGTREEILILKNKIQKKNKK